MPSAQDQLSKLTGTIFICMFMAFLMPSLGVIREFESYANLLALSIFIVTVVVNICIQIATGVIFSFVIEHIVILLLMLVLLGSLWAFCYSINGHKSVNADRNQYLLTKGSEVCMLQRLKVCYLHGYCSCPQLGLQKGTYFGTVCFISNACFVILVQAVSRCIALSGVQFCKGCSDYGWSVWILVWTQIVTISVCNLARKSRSQQHPHISYLKTLYPFYMRNLPRWLDLCFRYGYYSKVFPVNKLVRKLASSVSPILGLLMHNNRGKHNLDECSIENYKGVLKKNNVKVGEWILSKGVKDMERWMELNRSKSLHHLKNLLCSTTPSREALHKNLNSQFYSNAGSEESCLSIVILVEMAKFVLPNSPLLSVMENILDEAFEILHFVDNKINTRSFKNKIKSMSAEVLWKGKTTYGFIKRKRLKERRDVTVQFPSELDQALKLIADFHKSFLVDVVRNEALALASFLQQRLQLHSSLDDLSVQMKLLFVDMLYVLLTPFPVAIFNHILQSPAEEYEERVRLALKFICQMELIDSHMGWTVPDGYGFSCLTNTQIAVAETVDRGLVEDSIASGIEEVEVIQSFLDNDYA